jgi:pimeloyl-ACP methyl ester carboxylesterase
MIVEASATAVVAWGLRKLAHGAILRGLRAPRLPHAQGPADHGVADDRVRDVRIAGSRGKQLFGWMVSAPQAAKHPAPAVLVMHGWGSSASMMGSVVPPLHAAGFAVLLLDARCHGRSDDEAFTSMPRFAEDIAAGLAWMRTQPDIAADRLALLGHSVGAAAALLHASGQHDVRAVISLSAFAHPREMMLRFMAERRVPYPVLGWYVLRHVQQVIGASFDEIAPLNTIVRVRCPTLLVHGRGDATVPVGDATRLLAAAGSARLLTVDGDHDLRQALSSHSRTLVDFLQAATLALSPCREQSDSVGPFALPIGPVLDGGAGHDANGGRAEVLRELQELRLAYSNAGCSGLTTGLPAATQASKPPAMETTSR